MMRIILIRMIIMIFFRLENKDGVKRLLACWWMRIRILKWLKEEGLFILKQRLNLK